jgi:hypothetical protein
MTTDKYAQIAAAILPLTGMELFGRKPVPAREHIKCFPEIDYNIYAARETRDILNAK